MLFYFVDEIKTPFVINDIKSLSERFSKIILLSTEELEDKDLLPQNIEVFEEFINWKNFKPFKIVLFNLFPILYIYINECLVKKKIQNFKKSMALLSSNIYKAECAMEKIRTINFTSSPDLQSSKLIGYSFWFYDCIYLAWMRRKGFIEKAIARAHGGDLFEYRGSLGKILFRSFQFKYLDQVYSVSKAGENYLKEKYPNFPNKISTSYLGSKDYGFDAKFNKDQQFVLLSCAKVRNIKRIHKIAEMVQYIDFPITWVHLGDENLNAQNDDTIPLYIAKKEQLNLKSNVNFIAKGKISNEDIMLFYKEHQVNLFISLSETEGVPVSMMEAISFGVPILSTDVGGCREIVTDETGLLIPIETEMREIAKIITDFRSSHRNTAEFRGNVRLFWERMFNAKNMDMQIR